MTSEERRAAAIAAMLEVRREHPMFPLWESDEAESQGWRCKCGYEWRFGDPGNPTDHEHGLMLDASGLLDDDYEQVGWMASRTDRDGRPVRFSVEKEYDDDVPFFRKVSNTGEPE